MLSKEQRKKAIHDFKERRTLRGIYAVRCAATGGVWVGSSRNLDASRNGIWFTLRIGSHGDQTLQAAWNAHGEPEFRYEVLETLADDLSPLLLPDLLKEKKRHWVDQLHAQPLL